MFCRVLSLLTPLIIIYLVSHAFAGYNHASCWFDDRTYRKLRCRNDRTKMLGLSVAQLQVRRLTLCVAEVKKVCRPFLFAFVHSRQSFITFLSYTSLYFSISSLSSSYNLSVSISTFFFSNVPCAFARPLPPVKLINTSPDCIIRVCPCRLFVCPFVCIRLCGTRDSREHEMWNVDEVDGRKNGVEERRRWRNV